jgi:hypothetical protein
MLIIAAGRRNRNPCDRCEKSFQRSFRTIGGEKVQLMWPFFGCLSLAPNELNEGGRTGRCGNCEYGDHECSYEDQQLPEHRRAWRAAYDVLQLQLNHRDLNFTAVELDVAAARAEQQLALRRLKGAAGQKGTKKSKK